MEIIGDMKGHIDLAKPFSGVSSIYCIVQCLQPNIIIALERG